MKYKSKWIDDLESSKYKSLEEDISCDVLIIGGGLTGLSTAYHLKDSNLKIVLVERNYLGSGASSRSTAKINYLQDILYKISSDKVNEYIKSQRYGMELLTNIINENKINCNLEKKTSYLFGNTEKEINDIKKIEGYLKENNISYKKEPMPINIKHKYSISVDDTYTFNPALYVNGLKKLLTNIDIYEHTNVEKILKQDNYYVAYTKNNSIKAKKIIMATWYPFFVKPFFFPLKVHLEKSYLSCFKTENKKDITGINLDKEVKSFQYTKDYFIYLINSHILCNGDNHINFLPLVKKNPEFVWSNIDIITNDHLPFIGEIQENLYIGTGYNTWGNINSCLAGKILSDIILGKDNKYCDLFNPKRPTTFQKLGNNLVNCFYNVKGFIKYLIENQEKVYYKDDKAIYVSPTGKEYVVKKRCPHLKCTLIFNRDEHTWDCPCHGSRFDLSGNPIFGPSEYDIRIDGSDKVDDENVVSNNKLDGNSRLDDNGNLDNDKKIEDTNKLNNSLHNNNLVDKEVSNNDVLEETKIIKKDKVNSKASGDKKVKTKRNGKVKINKNSKVDSKVKVSNNNQVVVVKKKATNKSNKIKTSKTNKIDNDIQK